MLSVETRCSRLRKDDADRMPGQGDAGMASMPGMELSVLGKVADDEWYKTLELRQDMNLQTGEFVVMPNHIHGILMIGPNPYNENLSLSPNRFGPQSHNLASIIRGYKSTVTGYAKDHEISFSWQARFHEHVIRSYGAWQRISQYIRNNPQNWQKDKFCKPTING